MSILTWMKVRLDAIVVISVYLPNLLSIRPVFSYGLYIIAFFVEDGIDAIGGMAFFRKFYRFFGVLF